MRASASAIGQVRMKSPRAPWWKMRMLRRSAMALGRIMPRREHKSRVGSGASLNASDVKLSKFERSRRVGVAVVAGVIVFWAGLEVFEQYRRVDPPAQFGKAALEARDDNVALAKAKRFRVFRDSVRGIDRVGFLADPASESIIDRMLVQSL